MSKRNTQKDNYQDLAEEKEFKKGYKKGRNANKRGRNGGNMRQNKPQYGSQSSTREVNGIFNNVGPENDPDWYIPNGQLAKDFASIPFADPTGRPLPLWPANNRQNLATSVAGIMRYDVMHTLGWSQNQTDPLNYAANYLYVNTMAANSRNLTNEAPDMMLSTLVIAEAYAFYAYCTRIYGLIMNYDTQDRFTPRPLFTSMEVDYDDIVGNISDFRGWINMMAINLSTLYLPKSIRYVERRLFLYKNIYRDADSAKAQYYYFNPVGFYNWVEGDPASPQSSYANFVELNPTHKLLKFADLKEYGNLLLNSLTGSQDVSDTATNFLKAYGASGIITLNPISEGYKIVPVYEPKVLMQMENAYIGEFPTTTWIPNGRISQSTDINGYYIKTEYRLANSRKGVEPTFGVTTDLWENYQQNWVYGKDPITKTNPDYRLINSHMGALAPDDVLEATRFTEPLDIVDLSAVAGSTNHTSISFKTLQTEVILSAKMTWASWATKTGSTIPELDYFDAILASNFYFDVAQNSMNVATNRYVAMALLANFDWHFGMQFVQLTTGSNDVLSVMPKMWDTDTWTYIDKSQLEAINQMAELGLFMPRSIGTFGTAKV